MTEKIKSEIISVEVRRDYGDSYFYYQRIKFTGIFLDNAEEIIIEKIKKIRKKVLTEWEKGPSI